MPIGAEVTVFGKFAGENLCMHSSCSTITKIISVEDEVYEVTDAHGQTHQIYRSDMRLRKRHSVACGHVTDDNVHD